MGNTLYLDCTCGISGDMMVAALLDLGGDADRLRTALASLPVEGYEVRIGRVSKAGLDCCDFDVVLDGAHENHDHDMAYLHGRDHDEGHDHGRHHHHHDGDRDHHGRHECGHHHHVHRGPADLRQIIDAGELAPRARILARRMVDVLAAAEAAAHGVALDEVHFHEVGAVDSIVDIVSVAVLVDDLDIDRVIVPRLVDGCGTIRCQHGVIPVPVPATLNVVEQHGLPLSVSDVEGELVTPTGAAIVAALDAETELPARMRVRSLGIGAGKRAYARPSILRAMLIEPLAAPITVSASAPMVAPMPAEPTIDEALEGPIVRLECDIDDATGEVLAFAAEKLRHAGAREVHWVPVFTKKGRPAWQLQVIAAPGDVERLERIVFAETTTVGIRRWACERTVLPRTSITIETAWGPVRAKTVVLPDGTRRTSPEYEDLAAIASRTGIPLQQVMAETQLGIMGSNA